MKTSGEILQEKGQEIISVPVGTTIYEAAKVMTQNKIGAILVTKDDVIIGIWTERDLLHNIVSEDFNPKTAFIENYMVAGLQTASHTATVYNLLDKFLGMRLRHLLIVEEGNYIGLLSTGDVVKATLFQKNQELEELNAIVSWEYYENWQWKKHK